MLIYQLVLRISGSITKICYTKTLPNVRRLVWPAEIQYTFKNITLRFVGFCFHILHFICEADQITIDPTYTSRIVVPVACLQILLVGSLVTISSRKRGLFARYSLSFQENKEVQTNDELRRVQENLAVDSASQKPWKFRSVQECSGMMERRNTDQKAKHFSHSLGPSQTVEDELICNLSRSKRSLICKARPLGQTSNLIGSQPIDQHGLLSVCVIRIGAGRSRFSWTNSVDLNVELITTLICLLSSVRLI